MLQATLILLRNYFFFLFYIHQQLVEIGCYKIFLTIVDIIQYNQKNIFLTVESCKMHFTNVNYIERKKQSYSLSENK